MIRVFGPGLFGVAMFALYVYAVLDVIATDSVLVRNLPKSTWVFLVLFFPGIGAIAWLVLGRPEYAGMRPGDTERRQRPQRPVGFEDSEQWTHGRPPGAPAPPRHSEADLAARERRLQEREAELRRREQGLGDD